ncbi:Xylose repressor [[Clostridium] ultunense Esp]|nr:Xylose repressor [[Clostridium] ultunense Esp]
MVKNTGDQYLVKKINKSIVLDLIRSKSPLSRAQISEVSGLNKGTVSSLVNELMEEKLVYEIGLGKSSGGRRPIMLLFNQSAGFAVGVDLGVNYILTVLTDLNGTVVQEEFIPYSNLSFQEILILLKSSITKIIEHAPNSPYGIIGIGVGVPGIVDEKGIILFAPNLNWKETDLKSILYEEFHVPVTIDNEANTGALGEKRYGAGQDISNLIYVSIGIGIGVGIILNNELFRGTSGYSGEIGHSVIEMNGRKCSCGNRGCWEMYASEQALLEEAKRLNLSKLDLETVVQAADQGSPEAITLFSEIGEYIGVGIANIMNTFNPDLILIGNRMTMAEKWISNPMRRVVESRALPYHRKDAQIRFSSLSIYSAVRGAASLAINEFFSQSQSNVSIGLNFLSSQT